MNETDVKEDIIKKTTATWYIQNMPKNKFFFKCHIYAW